MTPTAYVSHFDCARHDTGWNHPDHQGRLPALTRAVHRDMLTLHHALLQVEATPAKVADLLLVHTRRHVDAVRGEVARAADAGATGEIDGVRVSGASWDAALAGAGAVLTAVDTVLAEEARNAFCVARPPGRGASADQAGEFSLFNHVAIAARRLRDRGDAARVLVVDWGTRPALATASLLSGDEQVVVVSLHQHPRAFPSPEADPVSGANDGDVPVAEDPPLWMALAPGSGGAVFDQALAAALAEVASDGGADFVLLSTGLDVLAGDPLGALAVEPAEVYGLTVRLREWADRHSGGRLVSVLEGGYGPGLGEAVVQHLRALAGLPAA